MYKDDLVYEFNDDMWSLYHDGSIDCVDTFTRETHQWLENKVCLLYTSPSPRDS